MRCCRRRTKFLTVVTALSTITLLHWYTSTADSSTSSKSTVEQHTPTRPRHDGHVNTFTDLLSDLWAFGSDRDVTENSESELSQQSLENAHTTEMHEVETQVKTKKQMTKGPADNHKSSWLFDNSRVIVYPSITDDVLPEYFDPHADQVSQFERYHDLTENIIEKRLQTLEKTCEKIRAYIRYEQDFIFYFPELNMSWCPVFKAASTNWKQFFCKIYLPDVYEEWKVKTDEDPYCPLGRLLDFSLKKQKTNLKELNKHDPDFDWSAAIKSVKDGISESVTFLTVRHPYERLVSMYTNKFKDCISRMFSNPDGVMVKILQIYRKTDEKLTPDEKARLIEAARIECRKPLDQRKIDKNNPYMNPMGATFKEVIQFIISNFKNGVYPDFHWVQVTKSCDVCSKNYQVIEKFETLERDHYFLLKKLGQEGRYPEIAGSHGNRSVKGKNPYDLVVQYFSQLDEYVLWDLQTVYKEDFAAFGYTPHFRVRKNPYAVH